MLFAGAGYYVHLYDVTQELVENAMKDIEEQLQALATSGLLRGNLSAAEQLKLITGEQLHMHFLFNFVGVLYTVHNACHFIVDHPQEPRL